jgi:hypothetical protein
MTYSYPVLLTAAAIELGMQAGLALFLHCSDCREPAPANVIPQSDGWQVTCGQCNRARRPAELYWLDEPGWRAAGWLLPEPLEKSH